MNIFDLNGFNAQVAQIDACLNQAINLECASIVNFIDSNILNEYFGFTYLTSQVMSTFICIQRY